MRSPGADNGCTFVNAAIGAQDSSLRMESGFIDAPSVAPQPGDSVVDLRGDRILPGLINAHDHLQLNNFPRLKYRERHENVAQWIADIDTQRATDPAIAESARVARDLRLRLGGVKNILSGVTTVAHHDPWYPVLGAVDFPCRVLPDYGWAHSLALDGEFKVRESYRGTPANRRWFIHAGEGVDAAARREFSTLESSRMHRVQHAADSWRGVHRGGTWAPGGARRRSHLVSQLELFPARRHGRVRRPHLPGPRRAWQRLAPEWRRRSARRTRGRAGKLRSRRGRSRIDGHLGSRDVAGVVGSRRVTRWRTR